MSSLILLFNSFNATIPSWSYTSSGSLLLNGSTNSTFTSNLFIPFKFSNLEQVLDVCGQSYIVIGSYRTNNLNQYSLQNLNDNTVSIKYEDEILSNEMFLKLNIDKINLYLQNIQTIQNS